MSRKRTNFNKKSFNFVTKPSARTLNCMTNRILLFLLAFIPFIGLSQTGVSAGFTTIKAFGVQGVYPGIHIGVEIPRDDETSIFGRIAFTLPNRSFDTSYAEAQNDYTSPAVISVPVTNSLSYINFEGGTRYYFGSGYDYGWSAYGGSLISLSVCPVRMKPSAAFDEANYAFVAVNSSNEVVRLTNKGSLVSLNFGFNVGVKKHFSFGMLYFDTNLSYGLLAIPSNYTASQTNLYSPLSVGFNFGFRKDLF